MRRTYVTPRGPVPYVDMVGDLCDSTESAENWLRNNPHRLDLGRIGFQVPAAVTDARQRLDLWRGVIHSEFRVAGRPVRVTTCCHPVLDAVAFRVESPVRLPVRIAFPYGSQSWNNAADWSSPEAHTTTLHGHTVRRTLDDTSYTVHIGVPPGVAVRQTERHEVTIRWDLGILECVVGFPGRSAPRSWPVAETATTAARRRDSPRTGPGRSGTRACRGRPDLYLTYISRA